MCTFYIGKIVSILRISSAYKTYEVVQRVNINDCIYFEVRYFQRIFYNFTDSYII